MPEIETQEFGQYQLIEKIAQGGMAEIFLGKARDPHGIEKPVVIKRILPQIAASPEFVEMLIDEAKIAVMLSHGNIKIKPLITKIRLILPHVIINARRAQKRPRDRIGQRVFFADYSDTFHPVDKNPVGI